MLPLELQGSVAGLALSAVHGFSKQPMSKIAMIEGLGVAGDAHAGQTVQHRSRVRVDPSQPNLRQVHLLHSELLDELGGLGFQIKPGDLGENILTKGLDLLALPRASVLEIGPDTRLEVTGLRNPCNQIEAFQRGLLAAVLTRDVTGKPIRKAGVMAIVLSGGEVQIGDRIGVRLPAKPHHSLEPV